MSLELVNRLPLIDGFGRTIDYVRVSVTDRCNLRCTYCMSEAMQFLPRRDLLTLEELDRLCAALIRRGVRHLRLTGGEPLMRKGIMDLVNGLSRHLRSGALKELTLTTNGVRLAAFAGALAGAGVRRVNVSLDSLDRATFARITRADRLTEVLDGIVAAQAAGLKVKINVVALKRDNAAELPDLIRWAHAGGMDITLIETMPLGAGRGRPHGPIPVIWPQVRRELASYWTLDRDGRAQQWSGALCARGGNRRQAWASSRLSVTISAIACSRRMRLTCTGTLVHVPGPG